MPPWNDIETAPKDRRLDLWAKIWLADGDRFVGERFPDCRWDGGDSMCNRPASWSGLPKGWRATHWMERPDALEGAAGAAVTAEDWTPTGRTRLRGLWFGLLAYEVEETRMVNTWMPGAPHSPMNWRPTYRWRRVRFGGVIDLQGTTASKRIAAHLDTQG